MNIEKLQAGRELDALVSDQVMGIPVGWHRGRLCKAKYVGSDWGAASLEARVPDYSTDIASAWEVVERLSSEGLHFSLTKNFAGWWEAIFDGGTSGKAARRSGTAQSMDAPSVISLAAMDTCNEC